MNKKIGSQGFAVLAGVIVLAVSIMVTIGLTYLYSMNRLRYHAKIKETYNLMAATETAAKIVKAAYDARYAAAMPAPNPTTVTTNARTDINNLPEPRCTAMYGAGNYIEVNNPGGGAPFCFTYAANEQISVAQNQKQKSKLISFIARLHHFFDGQPKITKIEKTSFISWLINEKKALALTSPTNAAVAINCGTDPTNQACARCRDGAAASPPIRSACVVLSVCPWQWSECRVGGVGVRQAIRVSASQLDDSY